MEHVMPPPTGKLSIPFHPPTSAPAVLQVPFLVQAYHLGIGIAWVAAGEQTRTVRQARKWTELAAALTISLFIPCLPLITFAQQALLRRFWVLANRGLGRALVQIQEPTIAVPPLRR